MQDEPTPEELIKAVADFLRNDIAPVVSGHNAFKLRVSINALDLVTRQLALEQAGDAAELARLSQLLQMQGSLGELNRDRGLSDFRGFPAQPTHQPVQRRSRVDAAVRAGAAVAR